MALSKDKKATVVAEVTDLLDKSKLTVMARYPGTSVSAIQQLRQQAKQSATTVKVVKNRLFKIAANSLPTYQSSELGPINGQLLYAFNSDDELAPAQVLANFAKEQPQIEFVAALTADGTLLSADEVKALAALPTKDQLRGQLVGLIASPLTGLVTVTSANVRGLVQVLNARADSLGA